MSILDQIVLGEVRLKPTGIYATCVAIEFEGDGIYIEDGIVNIPVQLWEQMQDANKK